MRRVERLRPFAGPVIGLSLWGAAALYFSGGTDLTLDWLDEGQIVYPAWRVSEGAVPYREFEHVYGPSLFHLNGAVMEHFGSDLNTLRSFVVILKAAVVALVFGAALMVSPISVAIGVGLLLAAVWGTPWAYFTTPYASFYAFACSTAGIVAFLALGGRSRSAALVAGLACGLAATFKQTAGFFPYLSFLVFLVADPRSVARAAEPAARALALARVFRLAALVLPLLATLGYLLRDWNYVGGVCLGGPFVIVLFTLLRSELRGEVADPAVQVESVWRGVWLSAGASLPLAVWVAVYWHRGLLAALVENTVTSLPSVVHWTPHVALPEASAVAWCVWVVAGIGLLPSQDAEERGRALIAPGFFALATTALIVGLQTDATDWRWLVGVRGCLALLPAAATWWALFRLRSGVGSELPAHLLVFLVSATGLLYLHPGWDVWHALLALPALLPLMASEVARGMPALAAEDRSTRRWAMALVSILALAIAGPFSSARERMRDSAPVDGIPIFHADGIRVRGQFSRDAIELVQGLGSHRFRSRQIFVPTGEHLFYYLGNRVSPVESDEFTLYLIAIRAIDPAAVRERIDEALFIAELERTRPLIVAHPERDGRFREALPAVARFLDTHYEPVARFGQRQLWDRVDEPAEPGTG